MIRQRIEDLTAIAVPEQPALSPDGRRTVYVLRTCDAEGDRTVRALWRVGARRGRAERLTRGPADVAPAWSPDGKRVAFLRGGDGAAQIWVLRLDGAEPEQLTTLALGAGAPRWSPDGTRIAFAAPVDTHAAAGEDEEQAKERRASAPIVSARLDYQADGVGFRRTVRRHVHVLDLASMECRQVTSGDWDAGDPAWSPDGGRLAFAAATASDADLRPRAPVYVVDSAAPAPGPELAGLELAGLELAGLELAGLADGVAAAVAWTRDGASLLVVGTPGEPVGHDRLLRVPLDGGPTEDLTARADRNVMPGAPGYPGALPQLAGDGGTVLYCARDRGCTHLYSVPVAGGRPRRVVGGAGRVVGGVSVAGNAAAVVLATPASYGEVVVVDLDTGEERVRTDHGATLAGVELFRRQSREFRISDGAVVQGWLVRDRRAPGPRPLLLDIHGGPHNAWNGAADDVHLYHQELAARGWVVLLLNPRGSDGYGERFYTAPLGAWGEADAKDFFEPIDQLVAEGLADPKRLAVTGYSYGGYMTCYLTSRDPRFAAAVAGGVVSDLTSETGTSDVGHYLGVYELGDPPWASRKRYGELSPLARVERVRTPTLVYHGTGDVRCPVGQAQQWHTALRERGIPTRLVLYPDATHFFVLDGRPSHRVDFNRRVADWVEQYAGDPAGPRRPRIDAGHWRRRLAALAARHGVPGAALGILRVRPGSDDELVEAAHGVLNVETGVETTTDSVFQIGSMTKVWTATLTMQLVDEGLLDLDDPIAAVLPELRLADADVASRVTMRHLLTHTSGIDGDIFTDTGRGDDCLERYVALLGEAAQVHPLGATWSYCNSGFSLVGRVIERITGGTWDAALEERIVAPLGLERTGTLPEEALLHRAAVGHVSEKGGEPARAPIWVLPRALGPAGLVNSTVGDVLAFARLHLSGGVAPDGARLLSEASVAAMASEQAELPDRHTLGDSWGLGWIRFGWDGRRLIGHDGNTIGQSAFLRLLPDEGLAVTLLTNGGNTRDLYEDLYREILAALADVEMPRPLSPPPEPLAFDASAYVGAYERASIRLEVLYGAGGLTLRTTVTGPLASVIPEPTQEFAMVPVAPDLFVVREPQAQTWTPVTFYGLPTGERYLHFGARATPKIP